MDFSEGTGLDLLWMVQYYQKVYFMNPSQKMRETAACQHMKNLTAFLENHLEYNFWNRYNLPVPEKMDGATTNFTGYNGIENLELHFEKLSSYLSQERT